MKRKAPSSSSSSSSSSGGAGTLSPDADVVAEVISSSKKAKILPAYPLTTRNTVHTAIINHTFSLSALAIALKGRYGPSKFPAVSFRSFRPFVTLSVFARGKVVITGTDDFQQALLAVHIFCRLLHRELNIDARFVDFGRQNMVGSLALGYGLDLPRLYRDFQRNRKNKVQYHETFPGLRYWPGEDEGLEYDQKKIVLILFSSGAVVIAGAKSKETMVETVNRALPKLHPYRKQE
jgi:transcription initiation factor TFIID TATA-box-binding protein